MKYAPIVLLLTSLAAACGGNSPMAPSSAASASASAAGTWVGSASDSSSSLGPGSMMGQAGMGTMTWQLSQSGSTVTGSMGFAGSQGMMAGSFSGTMSGEDMTFTMDLPAGSMMSSGCTSHATGTAHVPGTAGTMTGTYTGSNSCTGAFTSGQMTMARR